MLDPCYATDQSRPILKLLFLKDTIEFGLSYLNPNIELFYVRHILKTRAYSLKVTLVKINRHLLKSDYGPVEYIYLHITSKCVLVYSCNIIMKNIRALSFKLWSWWLHSSPIRIASFLVSLVIRCFFHSLQLLINLTFVIMY